MPEEDEAAQPSVFWGRFWAVCSGACVGFLLGITVAAIKYAYTPGLKQPEISIGIYGAFIGGILLLIRPAAIFIFLEAIANFLAGVLYGQLLDRFWWRNEERQILEPNEKAPTWAVVIFVLGIACFMGFCSRHHRWM